MQQKKPKSSSQVHVLTKRIQMRFIPENKKLAQSEAKSQQAKLHNANNQKSTWNLWSFWQKLRPTQKQTLYKRQQKIEPFSLARSDSLLADQLYNESHEQKHTMEKYEQNRLKYACKMSSQHILLGNQYQLDLISIGNISNLNYVQVQYLWSIRKSHRITHVGTDTKKMNLLVIVAQKQVSIYRYDPRRVPTQAPAPLKEFTLQQQPKFLKVLKDGHFGLFYEKHVQVYIVTDDVRRRYNRNYKIPQQLIKNGMNFVLFLPPQMYQNVVSIFFQEVKPPEEKTFNLWTAQLQFLASQIREIPLQKVYQSKNQIKVQTKLNHYSKEVMLLSLGSEVLAIKKGYILDSANVNMKAEECFLEYIGNQTLLHIRHSKIQVYDFSIHLSSKPFKIHVKSRDSIMLNFIEPNDQYFKTIPVLTSDFLHIFQKSPGKNKLKRGQFSYFIYLTRGMSRDEKMKMIFPKSLKQFKINDPNLIDKCDMAQKMGYSVKQIYLQLWNRSSQSRSQDYSILIATRNYHTIKQEVIRKLKKQSMLFKQILNIQEACLAMLSQKIFSSQSTKQLLMDYISSHFFRRKLEMFKDIQMMQKLQKENLTGIESQEKLKMNIRQYQQFKSMEIKSQLIQYVNKLCHQNMKELSKNIRFLLRNFKFVFRVIYKQLLEEIIRNANVNLLQLLIQIPEILPYLKPQSQRPSHIPIGFYDGVWPQISQQQWKQNLYIDAIITIDNHQIIQENLIKNVTFKRNWLSQHDMVTKSVQQIKLNYERIKSEHTFYFFIAKLFQYIQDRDVLGKIIEYIELKYSDDDKAFSSANKSMRPDQSLKSSNLKASMRSNKSMKHHSLLPGMPQNLKGKVFLYQKIYEYFVDKNIAPLRNGQICSLSQFFELKDYELIRYCFQKQRSIKGLLLKNIKDIFKECLSNNHSEIFNRALLNYFISPLSQISDLKYILNRINNEKHDFHKQNQEMYAVLIQALERKLKIGTQNDIPIDQVLIYLQNIPLKTSGINSSEANPTLEELKAIENINTYSDYLRNSKINMSIYDILHKPQQVFTKLIDYQIQQTDDEDSQVWDSIQNFIEFAVERLMELQDFSQKIYHNRNTNNPINYQTAIFFIFLAKICENISRIQFVKQLLNLPLVKKRYDAFTAEGVVHYMYQWLFSIQSQFSKNKTYIKQLLTLLPSSSNTHKYISSELEFANLLSHHSFIVTYPISEAVLSFKDLKKIITCLDIDFLLNHRAYQLNDLIVRVYEVMRRIQDVIFQQTQRRSQQQFEQIKMDPLRKITLHQVHQIFIIKLLNQSKLKQVIPLIQKIMQLQCENPIYNIIYPILYIIHISTELNEGNKENLIMCVWYYFYCPAELMNILEYIITTPLSPLQMKTYIQNQLEEGKKKHKGYNKDNLVFRQDYLDFIKENQQYQRIFMTLLSKTARHIQLCKQEFKHIKYSMIMAMLCNEPYALTKFISCSDQRNVRPIRSLLSYAIMEDVFEPLNLLELGRRIFLVLLEVDTKQFPIQAVINQFNKLDLTQDTEIYQYTPPQQTDTFQSVMWKSSQAFRKKKDILRMQIQSGGKKSKRLERDEERKQKIQDLFLDVAHRQNQRQRQPSQYIFSDSDNEEVQDMEIKQSFDRKKSKNQLVFQPKAQREAIFESKRFKKPYSLYKSIQGQFGLGGNSRLFISTKQQSLSKVSTLRINNNSDIEVRKVRSASMRSKQGLQQVPTLNKVSLSHDYEFEDVVGSPNLQRSLKPQDLGLQQSKSNPTNSVHEFEQKQKQRTIQKQIPQMLKHSSIEQDIFEDYPVTTSHNQQAFKKAHLQIKQQDDFPQQVSHDTQKLSRDYFININEADQIESDPQIIDIQQTHSENFNPEYVDIVSKLLQINKQPLQSGNEQLFDFQIIDKYEQNPSALKQIIKQIYNQSKDENNARIYEILKLIGQIIGRYMELKISVQIFNLIRKLQEVHSKTISGIKFTDLVAGEALIKHYSSQRELFDEIYGKLAKYVDSQNIYTIQKFIHKSFNNPDFEQQILWDFVLEICAKLSQYDAQQKRWNIQKIQATLPKINIQIWNRKFDNFENKVLKSDLKDQLLDIFCSVLDKNQQVPENIRFLKKVQEIYHHQRVQQKLSQFQYA